MKIKINQRPVHITQSQINMLDRCEVEYLLRYIFHLVPIGFSSTFFRGNLLHECFRKILTAVKNGEDISIADVRLWINDITDTLLQEDTEALNHADKIRHVKVQVSAVVTAWLMLYFEEFVEAYDVIDVEKEIYTNDGDAGKLDGVLRDKNTGKLIVCEHKSKSSLHFTCDETVCMDFQALHYMRLAQIYYEEPVYSVLYNSYAMPLHKFGRRAETDDQLLDNMLSAILADPMKYFTFNPVTVDVDVLHNFTRQWKLKVNRLHDITRTQELSNVVMGHTSCTRFGKPCPYFSMCSFGLPLYAENTLEHMKVYLQSYPQLGNYEIKEPNSELEEKEVV